MSIDDFDTRVTESKGTEPEKLVRRVAGLRVLDGPGAGQELKLGKSSVVIGSHPQCDLVLDNRRVSSRHVEITLRPDGYLLRDLQSRNGTRVGAWRVERLFLAPGMRLSLGGTTVEVVDLKQVEQMPLSASGSFGEAVGRSLCMRALFAELEAVAQTNTSILLEGETGTGKSFLAEQIHLQGPRRDGPFEIFDCGAVSPSLIEGLLFGHLRGAFTGADTDRAGVIERAHGGTLLLDEIGTLPLALQPKLLRVLESRSFSRLGEARSRQVDVRIISATNQKLAHEVTHRRFRQDLFYRLAVIRITAPPLRERTEDLPLLIDALSAQLDDGGEHLSDNIRSLLPLLSTYDWPGNVRELRNIIERVNDLPPLDALPTAIRPQRRDSGQLAYREARALALDRFERRYIEELLKLTGGNVSRAAQLAGVSRRHITALIAKHGIERDKLGDVQ